LPYQCNKNKQRDEGHSTRGIIATLKKSVELKFYGHAKNRKTNECQNQLQQLHWKKQKRRGRWASDARKMSEFTYIKILL